MDAHPNGDERGLLIAVHGEIDLATADRLLLRLQRLVGPAPGEVALDLSQVEFMDCAGLRTLITVDRQVRSAGGHLRLIAVPTAVTRLFELFTLCGTAPDIVSRAETCGPSGPAARSPGPGQALSWSSCERV